MKNKNKNDSGGDAHRQSVKPLAGKHELVGGPTLADRVTAIEHAFDKANPTDGLKARFGRKDSHPDDQGKVTVTAYVEMVPAPEELEEEVTHKNHLGKSEKHTYKREVFDAAKISQHSVGERTSATGSGFEEAITALEKKLNIGGVK